MLFSYIETCYACSALPNVNFGTVRLNTDAYQDEIRAAALQFGVEEAIVRAIIHAESAYRANAPLARGRPGPDAADPGDGRALRRQRCLSIRRRTSAVACSTWPGC